MTDTRALIKWLKTLPKNSWVGVDEGGLTLLALDESGKQTKAYFEVGGVPEKDDASKP